MSNVNYRELIPVERCARCGYNDFKRLLHVHHKDGNHKNDEPDNLIVLCNRCHNHLHYGKWKLSDIGLEDIELPMPARIQPLTFAFEDWDEYIAYIKKGCEATAKARQCADNNLASVEVFEETIDKTNIDYWL